MGCASGETWAKVCTGLVSEAKLSPKKVKKERLTKEQALGWSLCQAEQAPFSIPEPSVKTSGLIASFAMRRAACEQFWGER